MKSAKGAPEVVQYEEFLKAIGFKRSDGAIFGLLALSPEPLTSEEIGKALGLSQGAVSQGLKSMSHWGAVESRYSPQRRAQLHTALVDSLSIVSTIFRKREQGAIAAFRRANEAARARFIAEGDDESSTRVQRMDSYITTCDLAQAIMDFAVTLSSLGVRASQYSKVVRAMPKMLGMLAKGPSLARDLGRRLTGGKERAV